MCMDMDMDMDMDPRAGVRFVCCGRDTFKYSLGHAPPRYLFKLKVFASCSVSTTFDVTLFDLAMSRAMSPHLR